MINLFSKHHQAICLISVIGMLFTSADLHADEPVPLSTQVAEETEGYLSDPARAGSLVGTIIAGAAIANPLAPILGSVIGFFVGKDTDYTSSKKAQRNAYTNRSLIPENDSQVASLSGLTGEPLPSAEQPSIIALIDEPLAGEQLQQAEKPNIIALINESEAGEQLQQAEQAEQAEQANILELAGEPGVGKQPQTAEQSIKPGFTQATKGKVKRNQQQQLAYACSHIETTQQLPVYCYYYSQ